MADFDLASRWRRVRALFEAAVELPGSDREALLDDTPDPPTVVAEVRSMLRADASEVGLLDATPLAALSSLVEPPPVAGTLAPGSSVGAYVVGEPVGRGSTAIVYAARRADGGGEDVALKLLDADAAVTVGAERFLREIHLSSQLTHPHIVPVLDSGRDAHRPWYAMPLYRRGTLRDRLARGGPMPLSQARLVAAEVAAALQRAHDAGVVHRDVKPDNLFVDDDGHVVVADFGVARAFGDRDPNGRITAAGMTVGTPRYMSPEQLRGDPHLDGATDQYALACVIFEALVGAPAFGGASMLRAITHRLTAPPPSARAARADVPPQVDAALRRALAIQPELRWPTIRAFAFALGA